MHKSNDYRAAFEEAVDVYGTWEHGETEPAVELRGDAVLISKVFGKLWMCSDIMPSSLIDQVKEYDNLYAPTMKQCTYAAASRVMLSAYGKAIKTYLE